jgi:hypothetical protein
MFAALASKDSLMVVVAAGDEHCSGGQRGKGSSMVVATAGDVHRAGGATGQRFDSGGTDGGDIHHIEDWDIALALIYLASSILREDPHSSLLQNMHTDIQILPS